MKKLKKAIDIILISAGIIAFVILANKIIPFKNLEASLNVQEKNIKTIYEVNTGTIIKKGNLELEMVIEQDLFEPARGIFAGEIKDDKEPDVDRDTAEENGEKDKNSIAADADTGMVTPENTGSTADGEDRSVEDTGSDIAYESTEDMDYSNSEDFRIEVDLSSQKVTVFYKDNILRQMVCSGGTPESPTPLGEYRTSEKIKYAWVDRFGVGAYYWVRFFEDYLIHSVPFDGNGDMIIEEYEKLGSPASHGCVRLKVEEAKWLYDTLPLGVKVLIY